MLDVWMAFLKDPLNNEIQDVNEVRQALDTLKEVSEDEEAREIYYLRQQTEFGYISEKNVAVEKAHKRGIEKGEKIGIEKGKAEERAKANAEKIETAKNFLKMGLTVEQVAQGTDGEHQRRHRILDLRRARRQGLHQ